jgi:hypothetical protein|tara:strand:+ start:120 stop:443 length:324 start_codon:yes stop_codon:yes gene_type:complete
MKFSIHQMIPSHRKYLAEHKSEEYFQVSFYGNVPKSLFLAHYNKVSEIVADDLDEVFQIGNIGPEECITRLGRMSSISVGDVIEDEEHRLFVVKSFGFDRFDVKEAA